MKPNRFLWEESRRLGPILSRMVLAISGHPATPEVSSSSRKASSGAGSQFRFLTAFPSTVLFQRRPDDVSRLFEVGLPR